MASPLDHAPEATRMIDAWSAGASLEWRQIAANIRGETALDAAAFTSLLDRFTAAASAGKSAEDAWVEACRAHQRRGPRHPAPIPAVLGRALTIDSYAELVATAPGSTLSKGQCASLLRRVTAGGGSPAMRDERVLRRARLGSYLLWATFDAADSSRPPFDRMPRRTADVRAALGLGTLAESDTLVLVSYATAGQLTTIGVFRPTVADAANYPWYRPHADPAACCGYTFPLASPPGHVPQPELVHEPVTGEGLLFPIHLVT